MYKNIKMDRPINYTTKRTLIVLYGRMINHNNFIIKTNIVNFVSLDKLMDGQLHSYIHPITACAVYACYCRRVFTCLETAKENL